MLKKFEDALDNRLFVYGGTQGLNAYSDLWSYDLSSESWSQQFSEGGQSPQINKGMFMVALPNVSSSVVVTNSVDSTNFYWRRI
jgi:hypothetical protein